MNRHFSSELPFSKTSFAIHVRFSSGSCFLIPCTRCFNMFSSDFVRGFERLRVVDKGLLADTRFVWLLPAHIFHGPWPFKKGVLYWVMRICFTNFEQAGGSCGVLSTQISGELSSKYCISAQLDLVGEELDGFFFFTAVDSVGFGW